MRLWLTAAVLLVALGRLEAAETIKHRFNNPTADLGNPNETGPDEWNDSLVVDSGDGAASDGKCFVRDSTQADGWRLAACAVATATPTGTPATPTPTSTPTNTPTSTPTSTPTPTPTSTPTRLPAVYSIPVGACQNTTAGALWDLPTSNPAVANCKTGSNTQLGTLDFADGANSLSAQLTMSLPFNYNSSGTTSIRFKWLTSATTGSVVWQAATICVADAETDDPSFNTASTVTDAAKGTTLQTNDATISSLTMTGCAAGELLHLKIFRDPTNGSDDLGATARLIEVELTVPRT